MPDQIPEWHQDNSENWRHEEYNQNQEAVTLKPGQLISQITWQQLHKDMGAIKRRQGNHIEYRKTDIVLNNQLKHQIDTRRHIPAHTIVDKQYHQCQKSR